MDTLRIITFASVAAIGNALFALGLRQSTGSRNSLFLVGCSALIACALCVLTAPLVAPFDSASVVREHWRAVVLSGTGLFCTYVGFTLLYTRFGASTYGVYASLSVITTAVGVGFFYQRVRVNTYDVLAIVLSILAIILFSIAQTKR